MTFAEKVKQLRDSRGWSQGDLARKIGVHSSYISQIESGGHHQPSLKIAVKLSSAFGVRLETWASASGYVDHASQLYFTDDPEIAQLTEKIRGLHPTKRAAVHAVVSALVDTHRLAYAATG